MLLELILIGLCGHLLWYFFIRNDRLKGVPPGDIVCFCIYIGFGTFLTSPTRFPIIGNIVQLALSQKGRAPYITFQEFTKQYGSLTFMQIGVNYQVLTEDYTIIKEILCSDVWVDRFSDEFISLRSFGKTLGVLMIGGNVWKEMRRFSLRTLRDFGFGKQNSMETTIQEELTDLIEPLQKNIDKGNNIICMKQYFTVAVLNTLWNMIAGFRFSHDDKKLHELIEKIDNIVKISAIGGKVTTLYTAFPILNHILPKLKKRIEFLDGMHGFFRSFLEERRAEGHYKMEQRDFIDVFLMEIDKHNELKSEPNYYTDEQFIVVALDLFTAGSETTSNTMEFAILYMILHPEVQKKVQAEIDSVIGGNRFPTFEDKVKMPFTEATLMEVQRLANVVPIIIRTPIQDTTLGKYRIPKGTIGMINLYGMHMDTNIWSNPNKFCPERFLDDKMNLINTNNIMPFGLGKRVCIGEVLARASLFIYFTTFLQRFSFEKSPHHPEPLMDPVVGFTLSPNSYHVLVKNRETNL